MKTKKINAFSILIGFGFIYFGISLYLANFSTNLQKNYSFMNKAVAGIGFDSSDSALWYKDTNPTATLSVTKPSEAASITPISSYVSPPPPPPVHHCH